MKRTDRPWLRRLLWGVVVLAAGAVWIVFWAPLGLVILAAVPVIGIAMVVRDLVRELRGRRPPFTHGTVNLSDVPEKPRRLSHFTTRFPTGRADDDG